ncbi:MAG: dihydrodipicolinate reductase [Gammaproteobacteria bacterium]|nr:dihydrodipicolinate reductase [Gammaproteobacteria bacterium]
MDIAVLGASGRVGQHLVRELLQSETDRLVACYVSENSACLGCEVDGSELRFEPLSALPDRPSDVLIDFSTPAATMAALDDLGTRTRALVVGTTGFEPDEETRLQKISKQLPVMISANFAETFEPFIVACRTLAGTYPEHVPQLEETYHERKKAVPSGTSLRVRREVMDARRNAGCTDDVEIPIKVIREGDVMGKHLFRLDLGNEAFEIGFHVDSLASYARGALQAGRWIHGRPPGSYTPADILASKRGHE